MSYQVLVFGPEKKVQALVEEEGFAEVPDKPLTFGPHALNVEDPEERDRLVLRIAAKGIWTCWKKAP